MQATFANGRVRGYASVFNVIDSQGDVVLQGAFEQHLRNTKTMPRLLWQHDPTVPIGRITLLREDAVGLYIEADITSDTQQGREALALLNFGAIDSFSIGYQVLEAQSTKAGRLLKRIVLWEVSIVTFPANGLARVDI